MLRPELPKVPSAGGSKKDLPFLLTKQPPVPPAIATLSDCAVAAVRCEMHPCQSALVWAEESETGFGLPGVMYVHEPEAGSVTSPTHSGIEFCPPDLKLAADPKRSQRSANSPVPLKSLLVSNDCQGWPLCRDKIPLTCQPSSICANDFL